jgi:replicative DNA helicase
MDDINFKLPPSNIDAERSVIGGLLLDNDAYDKIHTLKPVEFFNHNHEVIYRVIAEMLQERKQVDVLTLAESLDLKGSLVEVGGVAYLGGLVQSTPTAANIQRYAEIVQEKSNLRSLIKIAAKIQDDAFQQVSMSSILDRAQSEIMSISERRQTSEPQMVGDLLADRFDHFDSLYMGKVNPLSTGLRDLDAKIGGGLKGGQLVVVAGRPGMGKSALAVQIAEAIQSKEKSGVIYSCEMPNAQIVDRIISAHSKVSSETFQSGKFQDEDWDKLTSSIPKIQMLNLLVDDKSFKVNDIASKSRTINRKYGLGVIVIDYIQLLEGVGDNREQQVASISRGLKRLAIELDIPIIALSQLNRGLEARADKRPIMSDIRESGAIEQDADLIIAVYRDEEYHPDSEYKGTAELIILKNRTGQTSKVRATFIGAQTRFYDCDRTNWPEPQASKKTTYTKGFDE